MRVRPAIAGLANVFSGRARLTNQHPMHVGFFMKIDKQSRIAAPVHVEFVKLILGPLIDDTSLLIG